MKFQLFADQFPRFIVEGFEPFGAGGLFVGDPPRLVFPDVGDMFPQFFERELPGVVGVAKNRDLFVQRGNLFGQGFERLFERVESFGVSDDSGGQ